MPGFQRVFLLLFLLNVWRRSHSIYIPPTYTLWEERRKAPIITDQAPENYTVFPTDDIVLKCEAKGLPAPQYHWTKDGKDYDPSLDPRAVMNTTSGTIAFSTTGNGVSIRNYRGVYRCYARNEYGTAISSNINLITESTPKWRKEAERRFVKEAGESLVLRCNPPSSMVSSMIIWMTSKLFNIQVSRRVSQGLDGNLYFSNLLVEDSLEDYTCYAQITGTRTIIQKEPIALQVTTSNSVRFRKPRLLTPTGQSSTKLALRSRVLYLECIAEGLPTPTVHWERLDGNFPEGRISFDNFNKKLKISDVMEDDDGEYRCTVKNRQGQVRHTYSVTVEAAPYWVKEPKAGIYSPGETVRLDCDIDAKPKAQISWRINGDPLNETDPNPARKVMGGTLILNNVQKDDTAIYQCEAENRHGTLLANIIVPVVELPAEILTPSGQKYVIVERQSASLHCLAFGAPTPQIVWTKGDMETVLQDRRYFLNTSGTLWIENAQSTDAGIFTCNATNTIGTYNITATLIVKNASRIIEAPRDQHIERTHAVTFRCVVEVDLSLNRTDLQWKKDGVPIDEAADDESRYHIQDGQLRIKSVGYEDEGIYTCVGRTELDTVMTSAQLIVVDRPEPPFDLQWKRIEDFEVLLSWTPGNDHNSAIDHFFVQFEENVFESGIWQEMKKVHGDQVEVKLKLSAYVSYSFRVIAGNSFGNSTPSEGTERYVTPWLAPKKNPEGVKGKGSQPNNMLITWQVLKPLEWNAPNLQYAVKWRQKGEGRMWKELVLESPPYLVNSTPTFVPYEIQVQAFNEEGSAPEPSTVIGYSGEDYPLSSPEMVNVVNIDSSSVRVTWSPVSPQSLRGHLKGYNISYWKEQSPDRQHQIVSENHTQALLRKMEPYTSYNLEVTVFNGKGQSDITRPPHQFTTLEGVPSQPETLRLDLQKDTEVTASWDLPQRPNGMLTGYMLQYQHINGTEGGPLTEQNISSASRSYTVHGLHPQSVYKFFVAALTSAGRGRAATDEIYTSREGEPPVLKNISYSVGDTHTNISWIGLEGHRVTELRVQYLEKDGAGDWKDLKPVNSSQNFFMLDGLQSGTPYRIKLWQLGRFKNITVWEKEVETIGPAFTEINNGIATRGWFIGLISAVVLLILILLIACFIKRNKGGKYSVKDKEDSHVDSEARPMKDETFGEYRSLESDNDQEEKPFEGSQPSLAQPIKPLGSDDSLVEYGGSVDVQFNEDGSFIGQYSGNKEGKEVGAANGSSGANSPVNVDITLD